jgi:ABC-type transporter Mla MlaB component
MGFETDFQKDRLIFSLTDDFTIYDVAKARLEILKYLEKASLVELRSDKLSRADTAGIQLVISLVKTCIKKNIEIIMQKNSKIFDSGYCPGNNLKTFLYERVKEHD